MPIHLVKLCVGAQSVEDLRGWIADRLAQAGRQVHTTRMMPKRREEILGGGSLFWVIKGELNCRQSILDLLPVVDADGIGRCEIVLDPRVVLVDPRPRGPFQGWRYLEPADAPADLDMREGSPDALPAALQRELRVIGVL
jgi:hypothetical protein